MNRQPTHPGEILKEDVFPDMGLNASRAAKLLQISRQYMGEILNGRKPLTPLLCLKIAKMVGNNAESWMRLQSAYNLWETQQDAQTIEILSTIPSFEAFQDHHSSV